MPYSNPHDTEYLRAAGRIISNGTRIASRNGTVHSLTGVSCHYPLTDMFPLLTTKRVNFDAVAQELIWFLRGSTTVNDLHPCKIWDAWADDNGNLGPIYGAQWRDFDGIDQIKQVIVAIKTDPFSRRHLVSAWAPAELEYMALPPCHFAFQFHVRPNHDGKPTYLSCTVYQRSADWAVGVPFNVASYALLTELIANECHLQPGELTHHIGDAHVYVEHVQALVTQIGAAQWRPPTLRLTPGRATLQTKLEHIHLQKYQSNDRISYEVKT